MEIKWIHEIRRDLGKSQQDLVVGLMTSGIGHMSKRVSSFHERILAVVYRVPAGLGVDSTLS